MLPEKTETLLEDYNRIEQAITYLMDNFHRQPTLEEVAASVNLSEYHFQRLFSRWVGVSPKRFLQYLTKEHAKRLLQTTGDLLEATYASGLSGPGRLHDLFVQCEAVTPGEFKKAGAGLQIRYGYHPSPFGECLLAATPRGICGLTFIQHGDRPRAFAGLRSRWSQAELIEDPAATAPLVARIFSTTPDQWTEPLPLYLKGTNFQIKVWEALLRIPTGSMTTYGEIAVSIGLPEAARAVGQAVGANPVLYLIPCHRVIRSSGEFGNYRGGPARKLAMLGYEMAHTEAAI